MPVTITTNPLPIGGWFYRRGAGLRVGALLALLALLLVEVFFGLVAYPLLLWSPLGLFVSLLEAVFSLILLLSSIAYVVRRRKIPWLALVGLLLLSGFILVFDRVTVNANQPRYHTDHLALNGKVYFLQRDSSFVGCVRSLNSDSGAGWCEFYHLSVCDILSLCVRADPTWGNLGLAVPVSSRTDTEYTPQEYPRLRTEADSVQIITDSSQVTSTVFYTYHPPANTSPDFGLLLLVLMVGLVFAGGCLLKIGWDMEREKRKISEMG